MAIPRLRIPQTAAAGEEIALRAMITHPMITGVSSPAPRDMLQSFVVTMNDIQIFACDFGNGSAANPIFTIHARAAAPGALRFVWTHEDGREFVAEETITVT